MRKKVTEYLELWAVGHIFLRRLLISQTEGALFCVRDHFLIFFEQNRVRKENGLIDEKDKNGGM